ncbi:hypothetical protein FRW55_02070 [Mycoplasma anserisalpingitidis]|uniref:Lipoprotein n=1 Tax=Mycoplasma anserisalpingitidis TaxID=519450 RepID=A0A5B8J7A8_9MOLU|nr:hypothetical protein [Mycoplasma anserisalpingitidis]QDY86942.1 hypothetical protein FRW55_02070 [Mycoplasma anserisalpingitidis]
MKKIKNKLLLIGSVVSTSSFLALSASCSNKNEEEIKVENPNDNTQDELKINFDNEFLLNLDKEYFNFKLIETYQENNKEKLQQNYIDFMKKTFDLIKQLINNLKEVITPISSKETETMKELVNSIDALLTDIEEVIKIDTNEKFDEFQSKSNKINDASLSNLLQKVNLAVLDSNNEFDDSMKQKISQYSLKHQKDLLYKSTELDLQNQKSVIEYVKANNSDLYQLANELFQIKSQDKILVLINKAIENLDSENSETLSDSLLSYQATLKVLSYAELIQNNNIKNGLVLPQKLNHNIPFDANPAFVTTIESWKLIENDLDSSNENSIFIKNSKEEIVGIKYLKNNNRFISNQDEDIDEELTISIANIVNEVLKRNPKLKSVTRIKATDNGPILITNLNNQVVSNLEEVKSENSTTNKITIKRTEGQINVFAQYPLILQQLLNSNLIQISQDDLNFIVLIFNY